MFGYLQHFVTWVDKPLAAGRPGAGLGGVRGGWFLGGWGRAGNKVLRPATSGLGWRCSSGSYLKSPDLGAAWVLFSSSLIASPEFRSLPTEIERGEGIFVHHDSMCSVFGCSPLASHSSSAAESRPLTPHNTSSELVVIRAVGMSSSWETSNDADVGAADLRCDLCGKSSLDRS